MDKDLSLEERIEAMENSTKQKALLSPAQAHSGRSSRWVTEAIFIGLGVLMLFNINSRAAALETRVISLEAQVVRLAEVEQNIEAIEDKAHNLEMVLDDIYKAIGHRLPRPRR